LPDLTYKDITTGTAPKSSSTLILGPLAVGGSLKSKLVLRNTSQETVTVTEIVASIITQSITSLTNGSTLFAKNKVANDFSIAYVDDSDQLVTFSEFTGTSLVRMLTGLNLSLDSLEALSFVIYYVPKLKVTPTVAMLTPFVSATAPSLAAIINSNRKLKIQLHGYLNSNPNNVIALGDAITIKAAVI